MEVWPALIYNNQTPERTVESRLTIVLWSLQIFLQHLSDIVESIPLFKVLCKWHFHDMCPRRPGNGRT